MDWSHLSLMIFEITRTIYSNSERSEQFLATESFFNYPLVPNSSIELPNSNRLKKLMENTKHKQKNHSKLEFLI